MKRLKRVLATVIIFTLLFTVMPSGITVKAEEQATILYCGKGVGDQGNDPYVAIENYDVILKGATYNDIDGTITLTSIWIDKNGNGNVDADDKSVVLDGFETKVASPNDPMNIITKTVGVDINGVMYYDLRKHSILSGKDRDITRNVKITMLDGDVGTIAGGTYNGTLTGNIDMDILGGHVYEISPGSYKGTTNGNINTYVKDAEFGYFFGGSGNVNGNINNHITGDTKPSPIVSKEKGRTYSELFGGPNEGQLIGNITTLIDGNAQIGTVFGGSSIGYADYTPIDDEGDRNTTISGNAEVLYTVYGSGTTYLKKGNVNVKILENARIGTGDRNQSCKLFFGPYRYKGDIARAVVDNVVVEIDSHQIITENSVGDNNEKTIMGAFCGEETEDEKNSVTLGYVYEVRMLVLNETVYNQYINQCDTKYLDYIAVKPEVTEISGKEGDTKTIGLKSIEQCFCTRYEDQKWIKALKYEWLENGNVISGKNDSKLETIVKKGEYNYTLKIYASRHSKPLYTISFKINGIPKDNSGGGENPGGGGTSGGGGASGGDFGGGGGMPGPGTDVFVEPTLNNNEEIQGWIKILEAMKASSDHNFIVEMNSETDVPANIFEYLQGRDITVKFQMSNGIVYTLNGSKIPSGQQKKLNIRGYLSNKESEFNMVEKDYNNIPFDVTLKLEDDKEGKVANIFETSESTQLLSAYKVKGNKITIPIEKGGSLNIRYADYVMFGSELENIQVGVSAKTLYVGGTTGKTANINIDYPEEVESYIKNKIEQPKITYKTSNSKVATVSKTGKITAKKAGTATITTVITVGGRTFQYATKVGVKTAYVKLTKYIKQLKAGKQYQFRAKGYGYKTTDITFTSSNKKVLTIGKTKGKVTAKVRGKVTVTYKAGKFVKKLSIIIK